MFLLSCGVCVHVLCRSGGSRCEGSFSPWLFFPLWQRFGNIYEIHTDHLSFNLKHISQFGNLIFSLVFNKQVNDNNLSSAHIQKEKHFQTLETRGWQQEQKLHHQPLIGRVGAVLLVLDGRARTCWSPAAQRLSVFACRGCCLIQIRWLMREPWAM